MATEGIKVLIVDDNRNNIFSMTALLENYDMLVEAEASGEAALVAVQERDFDVMLLDIRMPGMDGFEVLRQLRTNLKTAKLPVIAVTAQAMAKDKNICLDAGADDYISKPIDTDLLIAKIEKLAAQP